MKKNNGLFALLGLVVILLTAGALLFPLGAGIRLSSGEEIMGYSFVFSNDAQNVYQPHGGLIGAFALSLIGAFFQLVAFIFSFGEGGRKFAAFSHIVGGLAMVAAGVLFFLANIMIGNFVAGGANTLGWGFIASGACAAISGLLGGGMGFKVFSEK